MVGMSNAVALSPDDRRRGIEDGPVAAGRQIDPKADECRGRVQHDAHHNC